jgi:hypothetical protein
MTLGGLTEGNGPLGETVVASDTEPEKPMLVTLIAGVTVAPTLIL